MQHFSHSSGPPLSVTFETEKAQIKKITLLPDTNCNWLISKDSEITPLICQWMESYCEKKLLPSLPLDLSHLPPFTREILLILSEIKKPTTYKELALLAKNPKASRAVGNACNRNPFPLVIPCHRVLSSSGNIGGFAYGQKLKAEILKFESP